MHSLDLPEAGCPHRAGPRRTPRSLRAVQCARICSRRSRCRAHHRIGVDVAGESFGVRAPTFYVCCGRSEGAPAFFRRPRSVLNSRFRVSHGSIREPSLWLRDRVIACPPPLWSSAGSFRPLAHGRAGVFCSTPPGASAPTATDRDRFARRRLRLERHAGRPALIACADPHADQLVRRVKLTALILVLRSISAAFPDVRSVHEKTPAMMGALLQQAVRAAAAPIAERREARVTELASLLAADKAFYEQKKNVHLVVPNITFSDRLAFELGERHVEVLNYGRGVTPGDTFVYLPKEKILLLGDLIVNPVTFALSGFPTEWLRALEKVDAIDATTIVTGHGAPLHDSLRAMMDVFRCCGKGPRRGADRSAKEAIFPGARSMVTIGRSAAANGAFKSQPSTGTCTASTTSSTVRSPMRSRRCPLRKQLPGGRRGRRDTDVLRDLRDLPAKLLHEPLDRTELLLHSREIDDGPGPVHGAILG